jgi:c-di-GMP-binding flagellar brake protein YcgR
MSDENFRTALKESEKVELIKNLGADPHQILQLDTDIGKVPFLPQSVKGLEIQAITRASFPIGFTGEAKLQFVFDHSRYETKVKIEPIKADTFTLRFIETVYKLQRRQNFRTKLPPDWISKVEIQNLDGILCKIEGTILDLSLTGAFLEFGMQKNFAENQKITGHLRISNFKEIAFTSIIKRVQHVVNKTYLGIEFQDLGLKGSEGLHNITLMAAKKLRDYTKS